MQMWPLACVFIKTLCHCKPFNKILLRAKKLLKEEKEKIKNYRTITFDLHSIEYFVQLPLLWKIKNKKEQNEKELSITVQKYSVIFDKSNVDFHSNDVKKNAWEVVAKELGLENGKY